MPEKDFEKAFDEFLEFEGHEETEAALFELVLAAFKAGWKAAGGVLPDFREEK